jgi:hypothetical protein
MQSDGPDAQPRKSLVLVVGAGASREVNMPTGEELKRSIAEALNFHVEPFQVAGGNQRIVEALYRLVQGADGRPGDINPYLKAARLICDAMPQAPSIDNFIDSHRNDGRISQCGKLAVAACILAAEEKARFA